MINVTLQKQEENHVKEFYKYKDHERVMRYMYRNPKSLEEELGAFHQQDEKHIIRKAIYVDDHYVGDIWCHSIHEVPFTDALLSCCIFEERVWNKGVASSALRLFLQELQTTDLHHVGAFLYAENKGSQHVLEKLKFTKEKTFEEDGKEAYFYGKTLQKDA